MMNRRNIVMTLGALVPLTSLAPAFAQPSATKPIRIGFMGAGSNSPDFADRIGALRAGLAEKGYVEGKNLVIEYRWAEGKYERFDALAKELVASNVVLIVTHTSLGVLAAKRATSTVPIVFAATGDAVEAGLVTSLARPGGNATGLSFFGPEVVGKRLELIKEALPKSQRIGVLVNPASRDSGMQLAKLREYAKVLKVSLQTFEVKDKEGMARAFPAMQKARIDAVVATDEPAITFNITQLAALATKHKLPVIGNVSLPGVGGLMGYGTNLAEMFRQSATYVDKILKGAKPADLPVQQPVKFDFIVNAVTAKALGVKIAPTILLRADRVIE